MFLTITVMTSYSRGQKPSLNSGSRHLIVFVGGDIWIYFSARGEDDVASNVLWSREVTGASRRCRIWGLVRGDQSQSCPMSCATLIKI